MQREPFVLVQAEIVGPVDTLIVGDSIVETNVIGDVCGKTFAAGIGGATLSDLTRVVPALVKFSRPKMLVVAAGTNDMLQGHGFGATFENRYRALLGILPVRPFALIGVQGGDNTFIANTARSIGARYIAPVPKATTRDGIHPDARGARIWRDRVVSACPARPAA